MGSNKIAVGLEIGTSKVCAVVGTLNGYDNIDILGVGEAPSEGVRNGRIFHIQDTAKAIKAALQQADAHSNVTIQLVTVGVSGDHIASSPNHSIITLSNQEREIEQQDIERLYSEMFRINVEAGTDILHVIPQDFKVDDKLGVNDPVGMPGVRLEGNFHVVTGQTSAIKEIYRCVEKAGYEVENMMLHSLASAEAVLTNEEKEAGVCAIDIGGGTTELCIYYDNLVQHTAIIPFGGESITNDIKQGCQVMRRNAEELKVNEGVAIPDALSGDAIISVPGLSNRPPKELQKSTLSMIIEARLREIVSMAYWEIKRAGFENRLVGGIVVTGGTANLHNIRELIEYTTGMDTRVGWPSECLAGGMVPEVTNPKYSTATGLLMQSLYNRLPLAQRNATASRNNAQGQEKASAKSLDPESKIMNLVKSWINSTFNSPNQVD